MMIKDGVVYKPLTEPGLGSVRFVANVSTSHIEQEIEYDEYGNMMSNSDYDFQPILFAGGLYDFDTKLYRFGARDYDPTIGRWTTKDPIGFAGGDTNLYAYVGGNPMSYIDPSGLKFAFGSDEARDFYQPLLSQIANGSMAGLDLITRLQNSTTKFTLSLSSWHGVAATRNGNEIFIHPGIPGKGNIFTDDISCPVKRPSATRVLAHELGHAAGASDNGPGRLNNINIWENSVMFPIDGYRRTVYEGF